MQPQHEDEVKRRLYKTVIATLVVVGGIFILLTFFAPSVGFFFGLISKAGKPHQKEDSTPPPPPYFYNAPAVTNNSSMSLKGFAEPGSKVILFVNGPETATATSDSSGIFIFDNVSLIEGRNTIFSKAEDGYQNQSENSQTLEITYDTNKPKITMTDPKDGSTVRNLNQRILVKGTVDKKCEVRINDKLALAKPDNSFELLIGVTEGKNEIKIEAVDEAGNKSDETIQVTYVRAGI